MRGRSKRDELDTAAMQRRNRRDELHDGTEHPLSIAAVFVAALGGVAAGLAAVRCARRRFGVQLHRAPAVAGCAGVGAILAVLLADSVYLAPLLAFGWSGVLISGIDLRTHLIPTRLLRGCAAVAAALLCTAALLDGGLAGVVRASGAAAVGAALGWGAMHVVWRAAGGGLGYGDVRLGGYLGLHLGLGGFTMVLWGLLAGFLVAALVGGFAVVALRRSRDHRFALGPSLVLGALAVICWPALAGLVA